MNKKVICGILLISFSNGQLFDDNSSYKSLNDAVKFAYQNKLNVLIEDFTGVVGTYCQGVSSALDTLIERYPNPLHMVAWHVPWWTPDSLDYSLGGPCNIRMDLYTTGTSTPMLVYVGDSIRIGGALAYWWEGLYPVVEPIYNHFSIQD